MKLKDFSQMSYITTTISEVHRSEENRQVIKYFDSQDGKIRYALNERAQRYRVAPKLANGEIGEFSDWMDLESLD